MIQSTGLKRKLGTAAQNGLRQAKSGGLYSIIRADQVLATKPFVHLCEYYLPDAFDFPRWRRSPTIVRNAQNESAR